MIFGFSSSSDSSSSESVSYSDSSPVAVGPGTAAAPGLRKVGRAGGSSSEDSSSDDSARSRRVDMVRSPQDHIDNHEGAERTFFFHPTDLPLPADQDRSVVLHLDVP